jgi:outer membrane lipase/esterase
MKLSLARKLNLMRTTGLAGLALALLASCGGGDQIEKFVPDRIVVFGDEASVIEADSHTPTNGGRKYTVNGVTRAPDGTTLTTTRDCTRNPIWVQVLANDYGYQFAECLTTVGGTPRAFMRAQPYSTVAMVTAQVTAYLAAPGFTNRDLVTVMVGTHDIVAALGTADPVAAVVAAGTQVGEQVVRITNTGARVIVATVPDVGTTPQGLAFGSTQAAQLSTLTQRFNSAMRLKLQDVRGGGHSAGLVLGDELVLTIQRSPSTYGIVNTTQAACAGGQPAVPPAVPTAWTPNCDENNSFLTTEAQTAGNRANDWLWAGPYQLGANAQTRLGQAAVFRARNNPF